MGFYSMHRSCGLCVVFMIVLVGWDERITDQISTGMIPYRYLK